MKSATLNRIARLEEKTPQGVVLCATPLGDNLWSITGGFGLYNDTLADAALEELGEKPEVRLLVIYEVVGNEY